MIRYKKNDYHPLKAQRSGVKKLSYLSSPIGIGLLYLFDSLSCFLLLEPPLYSLEWRGYIFARGILSYEKTLWCLATLCLFSYSCFFYGGWGLLAFFACTARTFYLAKSWAVK